MSFYGYKKEAIAFISKIKENNNLVWFEEHKEEYERLIREPSREFVLEMGEHLQALVPTINAIPKVSGSLFRIYRDTRFSRDKTPIKERIGLIFWQGSGKRMQSSSFYLHFSDKELFFAVGIRAFSPEMRACYREYILDDEKREELHKIYKEIEEKGYRIACQHYKRLPTAFKEKEYSYLALMDGVYAFSVTDKLESLFSDKILYQAYDIYENMATLQQWVYEMQQNCDIIQSNKKN